MKIPVILGQTGTGKTEVGVHLSKLLPLEIISADSRQVYKYLSIGTNKPQGRWTKVPNKNFSCNHKLNSRTESCIKETHDSNSFFTMREKGNGETNIFIYQDVPYHLVDFLDLDKEYNAGIFIDDTEKLVSEIQKRNKIPLIVGGTGLYITSFTDGLSILPKRDENIRNQLNEIYKLHGKEYLYKLLANHDPHRAKEIHPNNIHRIIRALEIVYQTGKPVSELVKSLPKTKRHNTLLIGLYLSKQNLVQRIKERTEQMFANGLVEEVKNVFGNLSANAEVSGSRPFSADKVGHFKVGDTKNIKNIPALSSIGYNWILKYLKNEIDLETAKNNFIKDTLKYAKNQATWFKKDKRIQWLNCDDLSIENIVSKVYEIITNSSQINTDKYCLK